MKTFWEAISEQQLSLSRYGISRDSSKQDASKCLSLLPLLPLPPLSIFTGKWTLCSGQNEQLRWECFYLLVQQYLGGKKEHRYDASILCQHVLSLKIPTKRSRIWWFPRVKWCRVIGEGRNLPSTASLPFSSGFLLSLSILLTKLIFLIELKNVFPGLCKLLLIVLKYLPSQKHFTQFKGYG